MPHPLITSLQNDRVKHAVRLQNRRFRDRVGETIVEGIDECRLALQNGFTPSILYICPQIFEAGQLETLLQQLDKRSMPQPIEVSEAVYARMAVRKSTGGVLMILPYWERDLSGLALSKRPFLAVIENVEKPGNLGAVLRTADAVGVDGVIVCSDSDTRPVDIYNPNAIRASLGAIFSQPVVLASTERFLSWAKQHQIRTVVATPDATKRYTAHDLTQPVAVVTGSEAHGVSEQMRAGADELVMIPMNGQVDSLNLSVSTAILLYEVRRQRTANIG